MVSSTLPPSTCFRIPISSASHQPLVAEQASLLYDAHITSRLGTIGQGGRIAFPSYPSSSKYRTQACFFAARCYFRIILQKHSTVWMVAQSSKSQDGSWCKRFHKFIGYRLDARFARSKSKTHKDGWRSGAKAARHRCNATTVKQGNMDGWRTPQDIIATPQATSSVGMYVTYVLL